MAVAEEDDAVDDAELRGDFVPIPAGKGAVEFFAGCGGGSGVEIFEDFGAEGEVDAVELAGAMEAFPAIEDEARADVKIFAREPEGNHGHVVALGAAAIDEEPDGERGGKRQGQNAGEQKFRNEHQQDDFADDEGDEKIGQHRKRATERGHCEIKPSATDLFSLFGPKPGFYGACGHWEGQLELVAATKQVNKRLKSTGAAKRKLSVFKYDCNPSGFILTGLDFANPLPL